MYTISLFCVGARLGASQSGPTAGGVDIYYYLSGHIALYLDAYMYRSVQSHFWLRAGTYLGIPVVWSYSKTLPVHAHPNPYTTANRIEVSSSLYLDSAACDPIPYQYVQLQCCSIGYSRELQQLPSNSGSSSVRDPPV